MNNYIDDINTFFTNLHSLAREINLKNKTTSGKTIPELTNIVSNYTMDGTLTADKILKDEIGYSKGEKIVGAIQRKTNANVIASHNEVTTEAGYYANSVTKAVQSGIEGTPEIMSSEIKNNSITLTPTVENTEGYIWAEDKIINSDGAITITAHDLTDTEPIERNSSIEDQTVDVTNKQTLKINKMPVSSLDASIISHELINAEKDSFKPINYTWITTVKIPEGYHQEQEIEASYERILPAPDTGASAAELRSGYQAYNADGVLLTGTMTEKNYETYIAKTTDQKIEKNQFLKEDQIIKGVSLSADANSILSSSTVSIISNEQTVTSQQGNIPTRIKNDVTVADNVVSLPYGYYPKVEANKNDSFSYTISAVNHAKPTLVIDGVNKTATINHTQATGFVFEDTSSTYVPVTTYSAPSFSADQSSKTASITHSQSEGYVFSNSATVPITTIKTNPSITMNLDLSNLSDVKATATYSQQEGYVFSEDMNNTYSMPTQKINAPLEISTTGQVVINKNTFVTVDGDADGVTIKTGAQGVPVINSGSVANNQITLTPSVTNTSGYILTNGAINGMSTTIHAEDLIFNSDSTLTVPNNKNLTLTNNGSNTTVINSGIATIKDTSNNTLATINQKSITIDAINPVTETSVSKSVVDNRNWIKRTITPNSTTQYEYGLVQINPVPTEEVPTVTYNAVIEPQTAGNYFTKVVVDIPIFDGTVS